MTTPTPDPKLLDALRSRGPASSRYRLQDEVARGGMGIVLRVWDEDLRRQLAMKVMLDGEHAPAQLARFLDEAQVTGQLDHPGIVPVHELGIDAQGRVFFTMKLVKGMTLAHAFAKAAAGADGWNQTRALSVVLRVCEAMAFAHDKGVIHRDLKPANVMVGKFGETYVMDWGLARVLADPERKDIRLRPDASVVRTERTDPNVDTPDSLLTMDGDLVGTPAYMPPEQAQGDLARVGPQSDVYAVGAILYHLLTGTVPYSPPGARVAPLAILAQVLHGPPAPIHTLAKDVPGELASICEKAMARALDARYASMTDLAHDLRAYLENRVVKAHATGAFAEMKKWMKRNRGFAVAAAALVLVLAAGTVLVARKNAEVQAKNVEITAKSAEVSARKAEFDQLSGVVLLGTALEREAELYPPWPHKIAAMQRWLAEDCARLLAMKPTLTRTLAELDARAERRFDLESDVESQRFLQSTLTTLARDLDAFEARAKAGVDRRLAWARRIDELTLRHPQARVSWDEARAALVRADDVVASTLYRETPIDLKPQTGLVPIGMNPVTKLWEFYELSSACDLEAGVDPAAVTIPTHESDGSIDLDVDPGIVFVLVPGGTFLQGAQAAATDEPNFDAMAAPDEEPRAVTLRPYFLARHEMTQGQWKRITGGETPSSFQRGQTYGVDRVAIGWTHPVEQVSWSDCERCLRHAGLALPTEAQWERGARGGSTTPWWTGADPASLAASANVLDVRCEQAQPGWGRQLGDFDDGFVGLAPVGRYEPNPFGLFDVHGNVWEWCQDAYESRYGEARPSDGLRAPQDTGAGRVSRGGGFRDPATGARCALRTGNEPSIRYNALGVRPARPLQE